MTRRRGMAVAVALGLAATSARAHGADPPTPSVPSSPGTSGTRDGLHEQPAKRLVAEPTKDLFDLLRRLRHRPEPPPGPEDCERWMVALVLVLTYGPTSGFGLGFAGNMAVYRGTPHTTRISSIVASVTATTTEHGLDPEAQTSAGLSLNTLLDSRDGPINPKRGIYARLVYRPFFEGSGWRVELAAAEL